MSAAPTSETAPGPKQNYRPVLDTKPFFIETMCSIE